MRERGGVVPPRRTTRRGAPFKSMCGGRRHPPPLRWWRRTSDQTAPRPAAAAVPCPPPVRPGAEGLAVSASSAHTVARFFLSFYVARAAVPTEQRGHANMGTAPRAGGSVGLYCPPPHRRVLGVWLSLAATGPGALAVRSTVLPRPVEWTARRRRGDVGGSPRPFPLWGVGRAGLNARWGRHS